MPTWLWALVRRSPLIAVGIIAVWNFGAIFWMPLFMADAEGSARAAARTAEIVITAVFTVAFVILLIGAKRRKRSVSGHTRLVGSPPGSVP